MAKTTKKSFYEISSPLVSAKMHLYTSSPESLDGKTISLDLTRSLRGKSLILKLRIKAHEGKLSTHPISLELAGSYIRRMFRKGIDYVEDSFKTESKDSLLIIKPFLMTRNKVSRAIRNSLREITKKHLQAHAKIRSTQDLLTEIMTNKIQKELSLKLKKTYPLALCEIRSFQILGPLLQAKNKEENKQAETISQSSELSEQTSDKEKDKKEKSSSTLQTLDNDKASSEAKPKTKKAKKTAKKE